MEIIVTLIVSSIVVLSALELYQIFSKMYQKKNIALEEANTRLQFCTALGNDINNACTVNLDSEGLSIIDSEGIFIHYEAQNDFVVRERNAISVTFNVRLRNMTGIKDIVTGYDKVLFMDIVNDNDTVPLIFEKNYSDDVLLNAKIINPLVINGY